MKIAKTIKNQTLPQSFTFCLNSERCADVIGSNMMVPNLDEHRLTAPSDWAELLHHFYRPGFGTHSGMFGDFHSFGFI